MTKNAQNIENYINNEEIKNKAIQYFDENPQKTKYSRKISGMLYSFRKINNQIYLILNERIGQGCFGYIKKIINIETQKEYAIKITGINQEQLQSWETEKSILELEAFKDDYYEFFNETKSEPYKETEINSHFSAENFIMEKQVSTPPLTPTTPKLTPQKLMISPRMPMLNLMNSVKLPSSPPSPISLKRNPIASKRKSLKLEHISLFGTPPLIENHNPLLYLTETAKEQATSSVITSDVTKHQTLPEDQLNENCWIKKRHDPEKMPVKYKFKVGFVMKLLDNTIPLNKYLMKNLELDLSIKLKLLLSIFKKLKKIHDENILHNDLNLGNILINFDETNQDFKVEIIDYGFAKKLADHQEVIAAIDEATGKEIVTASACEQFRKNNVILFSSDLPEHHQQHPLYKEIDKIKEIFEHKNRRNGFCSKFSDIFILGKGLKQTSLLACEEGSDEKLFLETLFEN
ncbi:MAG: protein kinase domain-containing protein, partial [Gammaproteobacteria bacterium]